MSALRVLPPLPYSSHELWSPTSSTKAFGSLPTGKIQDQEWLHGKPLSATSNNENSENHFFTAASIDFSPYQSCPIMAVPPQTAATTTSDGIPAEIIVVIQRAVGHTNSNLGYNQNDQLYQSSLHDDDVSLISDGLDHESENGHVELGRLPDATYNVVAALLRDDVHESSEGNASRSHRVSDTSNWTMGSLCYSEDRSVDNIECSNGHVDVPVGISHPSTVHEGHCSKGISPTSPKGNFTAISGFYSNVVLHDYIGLCDQPPVSKHSEHQGNWGVYFR